MILPVALSNKIPYATHPPKTLHVKTSSGSEETPTRVVEYAVPTIAFGKSDWVVIVIEGTGESTNATAMVWFIITFVNV